MTQRAPPTILPRVTGSKLFVKNCPTVMSAPRSMPKGIINMLATEWSSPCKKKKRCKILCGLCWCRQTRSDPSSYQSNKSRNREPNGCHFPNHRWTSWSHVNSHTNKPVAHDGTGEGSCPAQSWLGSSHVDRTRQCTKSPTRVDEVGH